VTGEALHAGVDVLLVVERSARPTRKIAVEHALAPSPLGVRLLDVGGVEQDEPSDLARRRGGQDLAR